MGAMSTFEYNCDKCGHHFEEVQSISAKALEVCPQARCAQKRWGRGKVKRVISGGSGLLFKGSGFYITDYRSDKYKEAAKKESQPTSTNNKPAAGSEPKTAPKTESSPAKSTPPKSTPP